MTTSFRQSSVAAVTAMIVILCSACSPVKGYPGPERPETEVATVTPALNQSYDIPRSATIDSIPFGDEGISILPGNHSIAFIFTRKGGKIDCEKYSTFDQAGYDACLSNDKHRDNCSCWSYVSINERCLFQVKDVECKDLLILQAGKKYLVRGMSDFNHPALDLVAEDTQQRIKVLTCRANQADSQPFDEPIGSGKFTAEQYGVRTACDRY